MDQVENAFNGRYREVNRETQQWYTYNHPVPEPRPGMVSSCTLPSAGKCLTVNSVTWMAGSDVYIRITTLPITLVKNASKQERWGCKKSILLYYIFIYGQSYCHYLIALFQGNQKTVNKSLSRRAVFIIVFILLCQWLKCLPLQCITNEARRQGISSSLHMPDKVLNFVKDHFLMDSVIRSQPLLLKRNARYTQIAVHQVQAGNKVYHVLFIGTGEPPHCHNLTLTIY